MQGVAGHSIAAVRPTGLGLASAVRVRSGAIGVGQDCLRMVRQRHPIVADTVIEGLGTGVEPCFQAVRSCVRLSSPVGRLWRKARRAAVLLLLCC